MSQINYERGHSLEDGPSHANSPIAYPPSSPSPAYLPATHYSSEKDVYNPIDLDTARETDTQYEYSPSGHKIEPLDAERTIGDATDASDAGDASKSGSQRAAYTPKELVMIISALAVVLFLAMLDNTIVGTALPQIASDFGRLDLINWVGLAYMLTSTAIQPMYGRLADVFGRVEMLYFAIFIFEVGSAICGAAQSMIMLIIGRAVAGIGGGGLMSLVIIIVSDIVSLRDRGKYMGIIMSVFALSSVVGPLLGGAFTDAGHGGWRWGFYLNLFVGPFGVAVVWWKLKLPRPKGNIREKLGKIDYLGAFFLVSGLICFLLAMTWGGRDYPWNSAQVIALLVVGIVLLAIFVYVELKVAKIPLIPLRLFAVRNCAFSFIQGSMVMFGLYSIAYFGPVYFQVVRDSSATSSGLRLLPFMLGSSFVSVIMGAIISKTGVYVPYLSISPAVMAVGIGLVSTWTETTSNGKLIGYLLIGGMGMGIGMASVTLACQTSVPQSDMANVTSLLQFLRSLGGIIGLAVQSTVLNNELSSHLSPELAKIASQSQTTIRMQPKEIADEIISAYVSSLHTMYIVTVPFVVLGFLAALFIRHVPLRKTID
ncbi:MFS general substrate transporter [Ramicandelaber brevisporus]|nr:MFS general substrate transporter [Ramicandelaber brevisporus]